MEARKPHDENAAAPPADAAPRRRWTSVPRQGAALVVTALLVSLVLHLVSGVTLSRSVRRDAFLHSPKSSPVKIRIVDKKRPDEALAKKKKDEEPPPDANAKQILEMPQQKTAAPDEADHLGVVNHKAKKEQRISEKVKREKAKDPGQKGKPDAQLAEQKPQPDKTAKQQPQEQQQQPPSKGPKEPPAQSGVKSKAGSLAMDGYRPKPRNEYEALLPTAANDLPGQLNAGYQDYVDDKVQEGDRIDINTTEYRYIGYFTNMRKAIELVWNYPLDAARKGLQGEVGLEFAIGKDGHASRIRVIKSSGYEILDRAIVEAIKLASPFSPLPDGFKKERLVVTGSFRYILNSYGSH